MDAELIPRDEKLMDGSALTIISSDGPRRVVITDGERSAVYEPLERALDHCPIRILPEYVEAGWFCEANVVLLTDEQAETIYVPVEPWPDPNAKPPP